MDSIETKIWLPCAWEGFHFQLISKTLCSFSPALTLSLIILKLVKTVMDVHLARLLFALRMKTKLKELTQKSKGSIWVTDGSSCTKLDTMNSKASQKLKNQTRSSRLSWTTTWQMQMLIEHCDFVDCLGVQQQEKSLNFSKGSVLMRVILLLSRRMENHLAML